MRFISPRIHGFLDYAVAGALITTPLLLDFAATSVAAAAMSIAAGVGLVAYSLPTDYSAGVRNFISWKAHLTLDAVAAVAMLGAPFVFGFEGIPRGFYLSVAAAVLMVVATTQLQTDGAGAAQRTSASVTA